MAAYGAAVIDFGAFPGTDKATVVVTGQAAIVPGSKVEAYLDPTQGATAIHSVDEHLMADLDIRCSDISAGVGFTINATTRSGFHWGTFNVSWVWL